jgi:citrate/tricarballylate utilization protein
MLDTDEIIAEAQRQLTICNACRYCEGYCAVFPALELRTDLTVGDVNYLANLCHDCRACVDACMYKPPHEFSVNIPVILRSARDNSYVESAWPRKLARRVWQHSWESLAIVSGVALLVLLAAELTSGHDPFREHSGAGSFYQVVPWLAMLIPALVATAYAIGVIARAVVVSWQAPGAGAFPVDAGKAWTQGLVDSIRLRYLGGGGPGCPYPDKDSPSTARRILHQLVFYGVAADFLATCVAAVYQDILRRMPPYPVLSAPVIIGTLGGVAIIAGTTGMIAMKFRARRLGWERPTAQSLSFLVDLDLVALSGLILLAARNTAAVGVLLDIHLALVFGLFFTLPYSKFVHSAHRLAALIRHGSEMSSAGQED